MIRLISVATAVCSSISMSDPPRIFMCGGCIFENAHDLVFWQDLCIVQRKKQRFAD